MQSIHYMLLQLYEVQNNSNSIYSDWNESSSGLWVWELIGNECRDPSGVTEMFSILAAIAVI